MRLRASIHHVTGATRHDRAALVDGQLRSEPLPAPAYVEIQPIEAGFLLLSFDEHGDYVADTWHPTVEDAKAQANFELGTLATDWQNLET